MGTRFRKLNDGWNADPNAPYPEVAEQGADIWLRLRPNRFVYPDWADKERLLLKFSACSRYRFTVVNDHGWHLGQCRFSALAPAWGEFYEVTGDFRAGEQPEPWTELSAVSSPRAFLFYLRDETFECLAADWRLCTDAPENLSFKRPRGYSG